MIQSRIAVKTKPISGFYFIAVAIALMIAANSTQVEATSSLDATLGESEIHI